MTRARERLFEAMVVASLVVGVFLSAMIIRAFTAHTLTAHHPTLKITTELIWAADTIPITVIQCGGHRYFLAFNDSTGFTPIGAISDLTAVIDPKKHHILMRNILPPR